MRPPKITKPTPPYFEAPYPDHMPAAIYALSQGTAEPHQQKDALDWIITSACAAYQQAFIPGMPDATAFMNGRAYSGQQIIKMTKLNMAAILKAAKQKE